MAAMARIIDAHATLIVAAQGILVVFFLAACLLHDAIPVCHYLFGL